MDITPNHILDACGLYCPEPVMMLHNMVRDAEEGQLLQVIATDPSTQLRERLAKRLGSGLKGWLEP